MILGIVSGFGAATAQSLSYLGTRHYVQRRQAGASIQLLVLGHIWMGIFALILAPFVWPDILPWREIALPLLLTTVFYITGQLSLVTALKHAEASRVSPLMTSKLILTGTLAALFGQPVGDTNAFITPLQWFAVILCLVAGISINYTGGRMKSKSILAVACAAASFSLSDWHINLMIKGLLTNPAIDRLHASLLTEALSYLVTAIIVIPLLKPLGSRKRADWIDSVPFSAAWFIAMVFLFIAFSNIGIMLGSILQCTRGFITILLAAAFMYRGHEHIEPRQTRGVILRRLAAGFLMFIGITLYVIRDPSHLKIWLAGDRGVQERGSCRSTLITNCSPAATSAKPA